MTPAGPRGVESPLAVGQPSPDVVEGAVQVAVVADHEGIVTYGDGQAFDAAHELPELGAIRRQGFHPAVHDDQLRAALARDAAAQEPA